MKDKRSDNRLRVSIILRSVMIGYIFSLICFIILAAIVTFTNLSEGIVPVVTQIIIIIGLTITGTSAAIRSGTRGWLYGMVTGLLYIIVLIIISWIAMDGFSFDRYALAKLVLGVIVGAIGGMIGINLSK